MKKIIIVVVTVCLLIIGVGIVIYISTKNHKTSPPPVCLASQACDNKSVCTCNTGYTCDGICKPPVCLASQACNNKLVCTCNTGYTCDGICKSPATYTQINNEDNMYGCLLPYKSINTDETIVKNTCDLDPSCIGYYNSRTLNVATDKLPTDCTDDFVKNDTQFLFKTKIATAPGYTSGEQTGHTNQLEYGCPLMIDSLSKNTNGANMLCDIDPECVGFYTSSSAGGTFQEAATNSLPQNCKSKISDSQNWDKFYRKDA